MKRLPPKTTIPKAKSCVGISVENQMPSSKTFHKRVKRGREFEKWERAQWQGGINDLAVFESPTIWQGKRGRIDIRLFSPEDDFVVVVEIKATQ